MTNLSAKGGLVDPALVVDAALLELLEGVVQPVVEAGGLAVLQLPDEDVLEAASRGRGLIRITLHLSNNSVMF